MKTQNKKQIRKTLKLKIIEHFDTQSHFAYFAKIDEAIISKLVNGVRDPSRKQSALLSKLLKTDEKILFKKMMHKTS